MKSSLLLIGTVLTLTLVANRFSTESLASINESKILKQIERQMPYPEFARINENLQGKVLVEFAIDQLGKIHIINMNYSNLELKQYVSSRLSEMKIQNFDGSGEKLYKVAFSFNLIPY